MKKEPWASGPYWPQGLMGANVCWVTGDWFEFGDSKMENRKRSCADYREMCEALFGRSWVWEAQVLSLQGKDTPASLDCGMDVMEALGENKWVAVQQRRKVRPEPGRRKLEMVSEKMEKKEETQSAVAWTPWRRESFKSCKWYNLVKEEPGEAHGFCYLRALFLLGQIKNE